MKVTYLLSFIAVVVSSPVLDSPSNNNINILTRSSFSFFGKRCVHTRTKDQEDKFCEWLKAKNFLVPDKSIRPVDCTVECTGFLEKPHHEKVCRNEAISRFGNTCVDDLCRSCWNYIRRDCHAQCGYTNKGDGCAKDNYGRCLNRDRSQDKEVYLPGLGMVNKDAAGL
ncbi:hypothetical protein K502DRAFT_346408 [Neoconidiobolus thromboides FSU 785]|nr:hypothetical protein K502DRAFT_346408 [Neoconidiobolus thromboides FSU 785]